VALKVVSNDNRFRIESQHFCSDWVSDTPQNRKAMVVFLRLLVDYNGKALFTHQQLAKIVESSNRQGSSHHFETFVSFIFLLTKRTEDASSSPNSGEFGYIGFVSGAGNSAMPRDYQFVDKKAEAGKTYFYYLEDIDVAGERSKSKIIKVVVPHARFVPGAFRLLQNFPNPFNPETWIPFDLAADATVTIRIYDVKGQLVRQLDLSKQKAGRYLDKKTAAYWDGKDQLGQSVSSGLYFYMLKAGDFDTQATQPKDFVATRRMVILK